MQIVDTVSMTEIEFGDRRRQDYGDIESLVESIRTKGLIHPLAVVAMIDSEKPYKLIAGGRRFRALQLLDRKTVPVHIFDHTLTDLELRSIELAENVDRLDMGWQERKLLILEIDTLNREIHGEKRAGTRTDTGATNEGWSIEETAKLLGQSIGKTSQDIKLARIIKKSPNTFSEVATAKDAMKIISKVQEEELLAEIAKQTRADRDNSKTKSVKAQLTDKFITGSFFIGAEKVPDGIAGLVEIDPPYGINLKSTKRTEGDVDATALSDYNEIAPENFPDFMKRTLAESYRILGEHGWVICWLAHDPWFEQVYQWIKEAGFTGTRMFGVWAKPNGQTMQPNYNLANATEIFFYARKGSPVIAEPGRTNLFVHAPVAGTKKVHPTERPIALMEDILKTFAFPGSRVVVPFLGSGNTILAANNLGMDAFGWEMTPQLKDKFIVRVEKGDY